jgi:cell division protein FtsB
LRRADRDAQRFARAPGGTARLRRELSRIDDGIQRLCELQDDIRRHRDAEEQRLRALPMDQRGDYVASAQALRDRERAIDEQAQRLRSRANALASAGGLAWHPGTEG